MVTLIHKTYGIFDHYNVDIYVSMCDHFMIINIKISTYMVIHINNIRTYMVTLFIYVRIYVHMDDTCGTCMTYRLMLHRCCINDRSVWGSGLKIGP